MMPAKYSLLRGQIQRDFSRIPVLLQLAPQMIYRAKDRSVHSIDGVGVWPKAASAEHFVKTHGGLIPQGVERCVVPAAPHAWLTALEHFGTMSFGEVAAAAIRFASDGFPMYPSLTRFLTNNRARYIAVFQEKKHGIVEP